MPGRFQFIQRRQRFIVLTSTSVIREVLVRSPMRSSRSAGEFPPPAGGSEWSAPRFAWRRGKVNGDAGAGGIQHINGLSGN